jgi:hypothetical protein
MLTLLAVLALFNCASRQSSRADLPSRQRALRGLLVDVAVLTA